MDVRTASAVTVFMIIAYSLYVALFTYLKHLDDIKCDCAAHSYLAFIRGYTIFMLVYIPVAIGYIFFLQGKNGVVDRIVSYMIILVGMMTLVFTILTFLYVRNLRDNACKCSEDYRRDIVWYWMVVSLILAALSFVINIFTILAASAIFLVRARRNRA